MSETDRNINRKLKTTGFTADGETLEMLEELASVNDRKKSQLVRVLIKRAYQEYKKTGTAVV